MVATRAEGYCKIAFPLSEEYKVPQGMIDVARRRTASNGASSERRRRYDITI